MTTAIILINTEVASEDEVLEELKKIEYVKEAYVVYGVYDIVAKVVTPNMDKLREVVTYYIRRLAKVRSTVTLIVVEGMEYRRE